MAFQLVKPRYVAVAALIAFGIALILFPQAVYDRFIWKYFVGPIVADAAGHEVSYHGIVVHEGYTILSELVYGAFLVLFIYLLYRLFEKYGIRADMRFVVSTLPFIVYGAVSRVVEDAGILAEPLSYLFISPVIYIQIGILFALALVYGMRVRGSTAFGYTMLANNIAYLIVYMIFLPDYCSHSVHPLAFALFSLVAFALYHRSREKDISTSIASFGMLAMLSSLYVVTSFSLEHAHFDARILVGPAAAAAIAAGAYAAGRFFKVGLLTERLNVLLIFGHMLDGMTTYFAVVNPLHWSITYGEKHPLPDVLMKHAYGIGYPLLKLFVILGVIYVIDDLKENLKNIIKFFVLFLGLSPGLRDLLRIMIGV